jgi:hypothetical protein
MQRRFLHRFVRLLYMNNFTGSHDPVSLVC